MKIKIIAIIFLLTCSYNYAESQDMFSASLGTIGIGYNIAPEKYDQLEISLTVANLFWEFPGYYKNPKARIGLEIYPFKLRVLPITGNTEMSFVNINLFSDIIGPEGKDRWDYIRFGPFVSINWIILNNFQMNYQNYIFSSGLRLTLLAYTETFLRFQLIDFEIGYRNINNTNNFFVSVKFDFMDSFILLFLPFIRDGFFERAGIF
jgi:hypothetical protein